MMVRQESPAPASPQSPMRMGPCLETFSSSGVRRHSSDFPSSLVFTGNSGSGSEREGDLNLGMLWRNQREPSPRCSPPSHWRLRG